MTSAPSFFYSGLIEMTRIFPRIARVLAVLVTAVLPLKSELLIADSAPSNQKFLSVEPVKVLDDSLGQRGLDLNSFSEMIRFVLASEPDIVIVPRDISTPATKRDDLFNLSSSLRTVQNTVVWFGDIRRPDGSVSRLGPFVVLDEKGLQVRALAAIATSIKTLMQYKPDANKEQLRIGFGCFRETGNAPTVIRNDLQQRLAESFKKNPLLTFDISYIEKCAQQQDQSGTYITGAIALDERKLAINLILYRNSLEVPLPSFDGELDQFLNAREEFSGVVAAAVNAIVVQYNYPAVKSAADTGSMDAPQTIELARQFIRDDRPYLGLALLQRAKGEDGSPPWYEIGAQLSAIQAPRLAEMQFRAAINRNPDDLKAHRDLGFILAASSRYDEASKELETSLSLPGARTQYAMIKYAKGDRNSARENAILARDEGDKSSNLLILLTRVALENSDLKDARKWLKLGLEDSTANAVFVSLAKEVAFKAYYKPDRVEAEETLRMIPLPSEPEVYMLRGRVAMMRAASNRFEKAALAESVNNFQLALSASKESKNSRYPELKTVELELAEAYFISGDFVRARDTAQSFLNSRSKPDNAPAPENVNMESLRSYEPVAMLITAAAQVVLKRSGANPIKSLTSSLDNYREWPTLYLPVPLPNGKTSRIQVAEWSFDTFDEFVCAGLPVRKKEVVEGLSALVQNKLATDQERKKRAC